MFITEHLEGRIQCVDEDFICINIHLRSQVDDTRPFIDQLFINKLTGDWFMPNFVTECQGSYFFDSYSLKFEIYC